jgi:hypothetical protein
MVRAIDTFWRIPVLSCEIRRFVHIESLEHLAPASLKLIGIESMEVGEVPDHLGRGESIVQSGVSREEPDVLPHFLRLGDAIDAVNRESPGRWLEHRGDHTKRRISQLSTGMRQKVSIARTIIHDPDVVVFDEPTAGLGSGVGLNVTRRTRSRPLHGPAPAAPGYIWSFHEQHGVPSCHSHIQERSREYQLANWIGVGRSVRAPAFARRHRVYHF